MSVSELMDRLSGIGASISADGDQVTVQFPEEYRRDIEELGPEIHRLKPHLMWLLAAVPVESPSDSAFALKVTAYLETLPVRQSATASEIAEAFHGRQYSLEHVIKTYSICEELLWAQILVRGVDGYGYQLSSRTDTTTHRK